jgi:hypothetical protein
MKLIEFIGDAHYIASAFGNIVTIKKCGKCIVFDDKHFLFHEVVYVQ